MRKFMMVLGAASLVLPTAAILPTSPALAQNHRAKEWRGRDGRTYCRRSNGTTGLIVGGVAGGLLGNALIGGTGGTLLGAAGGALGGRAIERGGSNRRCR